jgi:hypothetical protein
MKEDKMSSAFFQKQQRYIWATIGGYVFLAASLAMILVLLMEGWLW